MPEVKRPHRHNSDNYKFPESARRWIVVIVHDDGRREKLDRFEFLSPEDAQVAAESLSETVTAKYEIEETDSS
jgi:hypothetical protein